MEDDTDTDELLIWRMMLIRKMLIRRLLVLRMLIQMLPDTVSADTGR